MQVPISWLSSDWLAWGQKPSNVRLTANLGSRRRKTGWGWVFQNAEVVIHVICNSRGAGVVGEVMDGHRPAIWVSDLYGAQQGHAAARQICLAHQLRDCTFAIEAADAVFAPRMKALLLRAFVLARRRHHLAASTRRQYRQRLKRDPDAVMALLQAQRDGRRLRERYGKVRGHLFTFLDHPAVGADDNGSERELRPTATYPRSRAASAHSTLRMASPLRLLFIQQTTQLIERCCVGHVGGFSALENGPMPNPKSQIDTNKHKNQLLGAFEPDAIGRLKPHLRASKMKLGRVVCEAGAHLEYAYFPEGSVLSLLTVLDNGSAIESANIGREGGFGIFSAMYSRVSFSQCIVQLQGAITQCPIKYLQMEFESSKHTQNLLVSYSETLLSQITQSVGCNALHTVKERMCRWLLMMHDRAEGEQLTYTHEFLSRILGANRTSIMLAAQSLQNQGIIVYRRGVMQVLDRAGMEKSSCECYAVVKARFDAFLNPPLTAIQETKPGRTQTP
jgi:CRP-like cAMP-binding protein